MLIPGKSYSQVESRNSRVSIRLSILPEYVPFAGVIGVGSLAGTAMRRGSFTLFPAISRTPSINRHRGWWCARNVTKRPREGMGEWDGEHDRGNAMADRPQDDVRGITTHPCRTLLDNRSTLRVDGRVKQRAGLWRRGRLHLLKRRLGMRRGWGFADRPPDAGYGRPQAHRRMRPDDRPTSQWSFLFPIEADWSSRICTARPMQWRNLAIWSWHIHELSIKLCQPNSSTTI